MKLHLDKDAMSTIIDRISNRVKIRRDILEKDYYVTLILEELSKQPNQGYAYFKGGTSLYKASHSIRRFSQDIDLTVNVKDCTNSQKKARLERASKRYLSLEYDTSKEINKQGSITAVYKYESLYDIDTLDSLQRFGVVKIEATNFGLSEPTERIRIAAHIYDVATEEEKRILEKYYDVHEFEIETITFERTFIDKLFAMEHYINIESYFDVAKHAYDICVLFKNERIKEFLNNKESLAKMINLQREEEKSRYGGIDESIPISSFKAFNINNKAFIEAFSLMQKIYVLNDNEVLQLDDVYNSLLVLRQYFD